MGDDRKPHLVRVLLVHPGKQHADRDEGIHAIEGREQEHALGHLSLGAQLAREGKHHRRPGRDADGGGNGREQGPHVEQQQHHEHGRERERALKRAGGEQPRIASQPADIDALAELKEHHADRHMEHSPHAGDRIRIDQSAHLRTEHEARRDPSEQARQMQPAVHRFAGNGRGEQKQRIPWNRPQLGRPGRQEEEIGHLRLPSVTTYSVHVPSGFDRAPARRFVGAPSALRSFSNQTIAALAVVAVSPTQSQ